MEKITIGIPQVTNLGKVTRLWANIEGANFKKDLYFEVDSNYEQYLCWERGDAFVLNLLYFAMVNNYDIYCNAPLSERLYYQLTEYYIPVMNKYDPELFNVINLYAETVNDALPNSGAVGCSVSGGVDSFYTIVKNTEMKTFNYNISHVLIANVYNIYYGEADTRNRFVETVDMASTIAKDLNLPLVTVYTNDHEFWYPHFINLYCLRYASFPYALQKLFSIYYYSAGHEYSEFTFIAPNRDASRYDFFTAPLISNENITIYSSGADANRLEKVKRISDNRVVQKRLQVCNIYRENCSVCTKCMRTQMELYACGKLGLFENVFDLEKFQKQKNKEIVIMLKRREQWDKETLSEMKKNGIKIPKSILIKGIVGRCMYLLKKIIKRIKPVSWLYGNYKKIIESNTSELDKSERYNIDKDFAKTCDSEII